MKGQRANENAQNIDAPAPLLKQVSVFDDNHASAPYALSFTNPS